MIATTAAKIGRSMKKRENMTRGRYLLREADVDAPRLVGRAAARDVDRRDPSTPPNNDLYLLDLGGAYQVSREHFQIEKTPSGTFELFDRGSTCGTLVDDVLVGGQHKTGSRTLHDGSIIVVGNARSNYKFKFHAQL